MLITSWPSHHAPQSKDAGSPRVTAPSLSPSQASGKPQLFACSWQPTTSSLTLATSSGLSDWSSW